jgi:hypothetical protein
LPFDILGCFHDVVALVCQPTADGLLCESIIIGDNPPPVVTLIDWETEQQFTVRIPKETTYSAIEPTFLPYDKLSLPDSAEVKSNSVPARNGDHR